MSLNLQMERSSVAMTLFLMPPLLSQKQQKVWHSSFLNQRQSPRGRGEGESEEEGDAAEGQQEEQSYSEPADSKGKSKSSKKLSKKADELKKQTAEPNPNEGEFSESLEATDSSSSSSSAVIVEENPNIGPTDAEINIEFQATLTNVGATQSSNLYIGGGGSEDSALSPSFEFQTENEVIDFSSSTNDLEISGDNSNFFNSEITSRQVNLEGVGNSADIDTITVSGLPAGFSVHQGTDDGSGNITVPDDSFIVSYPLNGQQQTSTFDLSFTITYKDGSSNTFNVPAIVRDTQDFEDLDLEVNGLQALVFNLRQNPDVISTGSGDDIIYAGVGDDTLSGGDGDDILNGGSGVDTLDGGEHSLGDTADYSDANASDSVIEPDHGVVVDLQAGIASDDGFGFEDTLISIENVSGSQFDDTLSGDGSINVLTGAAGNDALDGRGGNDTLSGNAGDDVINGGTGNDTLVGGDDNDQLQGGDGDDMLSGNAGDDTIDGGTGNESAGDTVDYSDALSSVTVSLIDSTASDGSGGADTITNIENVLGGDFEDTLTGDSQNNILTGGEGGDTLDGGLGGDTLDGGLGDDILKAGDGSDILNGGVGSDTIEFADASLSSGVDVDLGDSQITDGFGNTDTISGIENLSGTRFADTLTGDINGNVLSGLDGNDTLDGDAGHDTLLGGENADLLRGGAGNDDLQGGSGNDTLDGGEGDDAIDGGGGIDFVSFASITGSAVNVDLSDGVISDDGTGGRDTIQGIENLEGTDLQLQGDVLLGDTTDNTIRGLRGDDTLGGGGGTNILDGGDGRDTVSYADAGSGITVNLSDTANPVITADGQDTLISIENVTGSNHGDTLTGNAQANIINGGLGDDTLIAVGGNDPADSNLKDTLDGGGHGVAGDTADYSGAGAAIAVNLENEEASSDGDGGQDVSEEY